MSMKQKAESSKQKQPSKSKRHNLFAKLKDKLLDITNSYPMIQTNITIQTTKLEEQLKKCVQGSRLVEFLTGIAAIYSGLDGFNKTKNIWVNGISQKIFLNSDTRNSVFINLFCIIMFILGLMTCFYAIKKPSSRKIIDDVIKSLYEKKEYTAIILMKTQVNGAPKILVQHQESWQSYLLPYCHYNPKDTENEIMECIKRELSHILELPEHVFIVENPYKQNVFFRIKKNLSHGSVSLIQFCFYSVRLQENINSSRFTKTHFPQFSWKSKVELRQDGGTMSSNGDVLSIIEEESMIQKTPFAFSGDSFRLRDLNRSFRIIWTITNHCAYECKICATNSGKDMKCSLSHEEKEKVLFNISSISQYIESLDISGGDPLLDDEDQELIRECYQVLPYTNISVTTTATGLDHVSVSNLSSTVKRCDITYDIPCKKYERNGDINSIKSRPYAYNKSNLDKLIAIRESELNLEINIHVPIHSETINREDIQMLLEDLENVHPKSIKFIRLMPVGRLDPATIQNNYKPEEFMKIVDEIMNEKNYDFSVSVNCALKTKDNIFRDNQARSCPMFDEKLGIDSKGNVFACMWAAYLRGYDRVDENPFYLGNLLETSLYDIVRDSNLHIKNLKEQYKNDCPVCCMAQTLKKALDP